MPALPGYRDRGLGGGPRRVDDSHQGEHLQIGDQREQVGGRVKGRRVEVLASGGQHAQALLAQPLVLGHVPVAECSAGRLRAAVGVADGAGAGQQLVGSAFHVTPDHFFPGAVSHAVERGHQLVGGVERQLGDPRVRLPGGRGVHAALGGQGDQRALGGVADQLACLIDHGVRRQDHRQQELIERNRRLARHVRDLSLGRVSLAFDGVLAAADGHRHGCHLVQRERPGLVRVDRRR